MSGAFPSRGNVTVALLPNPCAAYSGGTAPDSHRIPFSSPVREKPTRTERELTIDQPPSFVNNSPEKWSDDPPACWRRRFLLLPAVLRGGGDILSSPCGTDREKPPLLSVHVLVTLPDGSPERSLSLDPDYFQGSAGQSGRRRLKAFLQLSQLLLVHTEVVTHLVDERLLNLLL